MAGGIALGTILVLLLAVAVYAIASGTRRPAPAAHPRLHLVVTIWVKDATITTGPHPGFLPSITSLDEKAITAANAQLDTSGRSWVVDFTLTSAGADAYATLTRQAVNACPDTSEDPECAERFIAMWSNLTATDVANWNDTGTYLSMPYTNRGKLIIDAYIIEPILGGQVRITGTFTQKQATDLADALSPR
jgi:preprotein translocase subunit SecD